METERCNINLTKQSDYNDLVELYHDNRVWDYLGGKRSSQQIEKRISEWINPEENCMYWTVRERISSAFLGCIILTPHYDGEYTQVSYMFLSRYWGNGFAFETVSRVLHHFFKVNINKKLIAEAQSKNTASCSLLKRLGFQEIKKVVRFNSEQIIFAIDYPTISKLA
ncbi:Acetyltransferase (GNAT) domain-containing protein [Gracilibacillus ureilyticus]|uniref:Acetyltransferase (GNAT) domain-containing protein n=1 Tax=Gracilibacillus ureilyticus TaxID=531814 RepID=A0A1H9MIZ2_9BACI|nr:GNAT family N-acetyltransferase [Gracilibacillus ureilyticus]SER23674.1 Acetyltransferase (GNAT) domain-containing protein [Gracilibacillus ureilyticus]